MAHSHGNEYQVKIVREDATEELGGWMNSEAQVTTAINTKFPPGPKYNLATDNPFPL
jgi:hypothetical protein